MVFKVKQRAKKDYFEAVGTAEPTMEPVTRETARLRDGTVETETTTESVPYDSPVPFYTYNWPYDHFSLIELAKIESNVTFGATRKKPKPVVTTEIEEVLASPDLVDTVDTDSIPGSVSGLTGRR